MRGGHLSEPLKQAGFQVHSTDLYPHGYGESGVDFFAVQKMPWDFCDIITNPPYRCCQAFVEHALDILEDGHKAAFFLKLTFLEGKARRKLFDERPPRRVYVSSGRFTCALGGDFEAAKGKNAVAYAWFVWVKGIYGDTVIKWIN